MGKTPEAPASSSDHETPIAGKGCLNLDALGNGMPGLSPVMGQMLAEAAAVCLEDRRHESGVVLRGLGLLTGQLYVEWKATTEQMRRAHADMQEATERGACGVAILVMRDKTGLLVVERSRKGTGFDYWLRESDEGDDLFEGASRLEVSGILSGTGGQVASRITQKKGQISPTDHVGPGYVAVIEFGTPLASVELK